MDTVAIIELDDHFLFFGDTHAVSDPLRDNLVDVDSFRIPARIALTVRDAIAKHHCVAAEHSKPVHVRDAERNTHCFVHTNTFLNAGSHSVAVSLAVVNGHPYKVTDSEPNVQPDAVGIDVCIRDSYAITISVTKHHQHNERDAFADGHGHALHVNHELGVPHPV